MFLVNMSTERFTHELTAPHDVDTQRCGHWPFAGTRSPRFGEAGQTSSAVHRQKCLINYDALVAQLNELGNSNSGISGTA